MHYDNEPPCSDLSKFPVYENGKSYIFMSIIHGHLYIVEIDNKTDGPNALFYYQTDNDLIEGVIKTEFSPAVLKTREDGGFTISWFSDLEYIGEL